MIQLAELSPKPGAVRNRPIAFVDLETTGLDPFVHEVVEIAILRDGRPSFHSYVRPKNPRRCAPWVLENVRIEMNTPFWEDIEDQVADYLDGAILCGHNIAFDEIFPLAMQFRSPTL